MSDPGLLWSRVIVAAMTSMAAWRRQVSIGVALVAVIVLAPASGFGQSRETTTALDAQIARIFASNDYELPRFGPARWLDGRSYATVEPAGAGPSGSDIVRYDAVTGARSVLVSAERLTPSGATGALTIADYVWSADGRKLLIFTNTRRVWRSNSRGDYWVLDLERGGLKKLGGDAPAATLMFAKFSPDATRVGYVRENNLYVEHLDSGRIVPLTSDGSDTIVNGTTDWVYEEELGLRDAFRWSPDGRRIAYYRFDTSNVGVYTLVNNTAALYPTLTRIPYPKAGTTNSAVQIGVVAAEGGATVWMRTGGDPRDGYFPRIAWLDAATLTIQQLNRLQNRHDVLLANAATGDIRRVARDESKTWVDVDETIRWIDDGKAFLLVSERDGWRHIFRVAREGGEPQLVTRFDADIIDLVDVDEKSGWVYFLASPQNATERYLYRAPLGGGVPVRVTPADQRGTHSYTISADGSLAFHTVSSIDRPGAMDLVELPSHRSLRPLTDIGPVLAKLAPALKTPTEFFAIGIGDGVSLDGWMLKPANFDPGRKYPVIAFVYGEVASQTVRNAWGGGQMLFHRALADAGYVVISVDNRGTPAPKGAAWRHVVYGTVGDLSSKEQAEAIRGLAERYSFIDRSRVGIWGWSGGGSNTLNAMFRFPDLYQVGVAVAPVADQKLYDSIYQERYMGLPQENVEGYRVGSPINFAEGLRGKLLLVHGSGDDNVHFQGTEQLVNRLVALGKTFDLMVYPNRTHGISEGPGTTPHVYRLIAHYFLDHLPPGPR